MYCSELGQDRWLNENVFRNKREGTFVEFGAYDGLKFSNSYFYEKVLGWKGLLIEANPDPFSRIHLTRNCFAVNCAISDNEGSANFIKIEGISDGWSGLIDSYEPEHIGIVQSKIPQDLKKVIKVQCRLLGDLLKEYNLFNIDYMTIDVEGAELGILKTLDFSLFNIGVLDIENNYEKPDIRNLLSSVGYKHIARLSVSDIFIKNDYLS